MRSDCPKVMWLWGYFVYQIKRIAVTSLLTPFLRAAMQMRGDMCTVLGTEQDLTTVATMQMIRAQAIASLKAVNRTWAVTSEIESEKGPSGAWPQLSRELEDQTEGC